MLTSAYILDKLLGGCSLSAIATPNPELQDSPEHIETLYFPFVLLNTSEFWAKTLTNNFFAEAPIPFSFAFNPLSKYSIASSYLAEEFFLLNFKTAYKSFQWITKKTADIIWEYQSNGNDFTQVRNCTNTGGSFSIALKSEDDIWYFQPVDLMFAFVKEDKFEIKTLSDAYHAPMNIRQKEDYLPYKDMPELDHNPILKFNKTYYDSSFLRIYSDGMYQRADGTTLNAPERYKQLIVFRNF